MKWCWKFALERVSLWKQVIIGKFGKEEGGWFSIEAREGYGVGMWKTIWKGWKEFRNKTCFSASKGRRVKFFIDMVWGFLRHLHDWELDGMKVFLLRLQGNSLGGDSKDKMMW